MISRKVNYISVVQSSKTTLRLIGFLVLISSLILASPNSTTADTNPSSTQNPRTNEDIIIKICLISYLKLITKKPEVVYDAALARLRSSNIDLLYLFDNMDWEESLATLASLRFYKLGAQGEEIYHCLLLRKGHRIEKYLSRLLESSSNDCFNNLGRDSKYCLNGEQLKVEIGIILKRIRQNEKCDFD